MRRCAMESSGEEEGVLGFIAFYILYLYVYIRASSQGIQGGRGRSCFVCDTSTEYTSASPAAASARPVRK